MYIILVCHLHYYINTIYIYIMNIYIYRVIYTIYICRLFHIFYDENCRYNQDQDAVKAMLLAASKMRGVPPQMLELVAGLGEVWSAQTLAVPWRGRW